jgi:hypothetical protein
VEITGLFGACLVDSTMGNLESRYRERYRNRKMKKRQRQRERGRGWKRRKEWVLMRR